ncbi:MAG: MBL fold metallo-hydrolase, partial [Steroidobacteraceae bacterium]|nr:MBL fold metallo-hydrolase [Steroidobacteraceae bacterium]
AALLSTAAIAQPVRGDLTVQWNPGAEDCTANPQPPLQVHRYDATTFILRQNLCADFEAPLLYLLIGDKRALLIDSGAVEDPAAMPLAKAVADLLPKHNGAPLPLLVAHTHRHSDHRAGDAQLAKLPGAEIVPIDPEGIVTFYGFKSWFDDTVKVDLGGRVVEAIATPGHLRDHLLFYDANTGLVFSGDFLLPGRLLVDDIDAYKASADRAVAYLKDKPVTAVLGGHIELGTDGEPFPSGSTLHPNERALALTKQDVESLPAALEDFNGFYSKYPNFVVVNPVRNLIAVAAGVIAVSGLAIWALVRFWKRRKTRAATPAA